MYSHRLLTTIYIKIILNSLPIPNKVEFAISKKIRIQNKMN